MDDRHKQPAAVDGKGVSSEKRALMARRLRESSDAPQTLVGEPIAIVGVGCRFPGGADTPAAFWQLLRDGVDAIVRVPPGRWDAQALYDPDPQAAGKMVIQWGGFIEDAQGFDADFFAIAPREAERMDPQQRLLLEVAWDALENAGQTREQLAGSSTGVFVGVCTNDYQHLRLSDRQQINAYDGSGTAHSIVANRLSYLFNLKGPSVAVDTACSSSLVAVHLACQSLRLGECETALAGGVNLILTPEPMIALSKAQMLAPDGRCKTFDARANGYVRGEGCGVIVLKRLADALVANDNVLAVIRGSAVNQDGRTAGLTAPNGLAQQAVICKALANAAVAADHVTYIEAHGTGTSLGDPIEVEALTAVYGGLDKIERDAPRPTVFLGSVKTNIGHLEAAAGIAGLIKVVLAIQNRQIPPNLNFQTLNPNITLSGTPFAIPIAPQAWESGGQRLCAGVSSFGFGGTNAHIILEEAPAIPDRESAAAGLSFQPRVPAPTYLLPISAHKPAALRSMAARYRDYLRREEQPLPAVCYTAALHRTHHTYRLAAVGETHAEIADHLDAFLRGESKAGVAANSGRLVWVFTGQGAEACQLPADFIATEPQFREALAACDKELARHIGWSVINYLIGENPDLSWRDTSVAQPVIFAIQVALAAVWRSWGMEPEAVVGHSVGEIAAAHVAGILSLADAAWLVCQRGRLMQQAHGQGRAASIEATPAEAEAVARRYPGRVFVGASNSPVSAILSGEPAALDDIMAAWQEDGRFFRYLPVDYAFHSEQVRPFGDQLARLAVGVKPLAAQIPFVSTVTGQFCAGPELDATYWGRNVAERVRFAEAMTALLEAGHDIFLEIGSHPLLQRPMQQCIAARITETATESQKQLIPQSSPGTLVASLRQGQAPGLALRQGLAALYVAGLRPDWPRLYGGRRQRPVELPSYAWQHEPFWVEPRPTSQDRRPPSLEAGQHPFLGRRQHSPLRTDIVFESQLDAESLPILLEHRLHGVALVPAVVIFDMALSAVVRAWAVAPPLMLENVLIQAPLIIEPGQERLAQIILQLDGPSRARFHIYSGVATALEEVNWIDHAQGSVRWNLDGVADQGVDLAALRQSLPAELPPAQLYEGFRRRGLVHGESYQHIVELRVGRQDALGRIEVQPWPPDLGMAGTGEMPFQLAPPLFESCLQVVAAPLFAAREFAAGQLYVPLALDRLVYHGRPGSSVWSHTRITSALAGEADGLLPETYAADVEIVSEDGRPVARLEDLRLKRAAPEAIHRLVDQAGEAVDGLYQLAWQVAGDAPVSPAVKDEGAWLLFADSAGIAQAIVTRRVTQGRRCLVVMAGEHFHRPAPDTFIVNPLRPEDFSRLWQEAVSTPTLSCTAVLYLWGTKPDDGPGLLQSALNVAQMVARHAATGTRLWFVTREVDSVAGGAPEFAAAPDGLWGLASTFALEHGASWGGCISFAGGLPPGRVAEAVQNEVLARDEDLIAIRDAGRFVARLRPLQLPKGPSPSVRPDRTYLVTGGLGALGQETVRWLAGQGARHLAVVSRRPAGSPEAESLRRSLPDSVQVHFFQTDVSDREALADVIGAIMRDGPALAGIFHLAGVLDDGVLLQQSWQRFARVLAPKAEAAWHLHELTEGLPLDYFILFSSVAGLLGAAGQANYAAANACLDGLAHYRHRRGLPALSIDWSVWGKVGMAARLTESEQARLYAYGLQPILPEHGLALLGQLLAVAGPQAIVLPVDWHRFVQALPGWRGRSLLRELLPASTQVEKDEESAQFVRARLQSLEAPVRQDELKRLMAEQVRSVLGLAPGHRLDPKRGFFQLGMDSLMAVELQQRLQRLLGVALPATAVFDYPSLESMAGYLDSLLRPVGNDENGGRIETDESLAAALVEVEGLTDEELDALLTASEQD